MQKNKVQGFRLCTHNNGQIFDTKETDMSSQYRRFSRYIIAAMLVDGKQKIAH